MWPTVALDSQAFSSAFRAVFCGYPESSASDRLELYKSHDGKKHWLTTKPEAEALDMISVQIDGSKNYRNTAEEAGFRFINFSDVSAGNQALLADYRAWRSSN